MAGVLRIEAECDWDSECALWVSIRSGSFGGRGRAWVHALDIVEFGESLGRLADTGQGEAKVGGGYGMKGGWHATVQLRVAPIGKRGYMRAVAELTSDPFGDDPRSLHRVVAAIDVEPAALQVLAAELRKAGPAKSVTAEVSGECAV